MKDSIRKFQLDRSVLSIFRSGAIRAGGHAARSRSIQNATSTRTLTLWRRTPRPILRRADAPRLLSTHTMASACAGMVSVASLSARQVNGVRARQPVRPPTAHPGPRQVSRDASIALAGSRRRREPARGDLAGDDRCGASGDVVFSAPRCSLHRDSLIVRVGPRRRPAASARALQQGVRTFTRHVLESHLTLYPLLSLGRFARPSARLSR